MLSSLLGNVILLGLAGIISVPLICGQNVFELLQQSKPTVTDDDMASWMRGVVPAGNQFPTLSEIPTTSFSCSDVAGPGFYADTETQCQVFRRCDLRGTTSSFLCTNGTIFNQLTLTCDWWYNVDCSKAKSFYDFANSKLYLGSDTPLFDSPPASWQAPTDKSQAGVTRQGQGSSSASSRGVRSGNGVTPKRKVRSFGRKTTKQSSFFTPGSDVETTSLTSQH